MEILWNENPLLTEVVLTDTEKQLLVSNFKQHKYLSLLFKIKISLSVDKDSSKALSLIEELYEISKISLETPIVQDLIDSLSDTHLGDCVNIPCTCWKCWAESLVGVDTIGELAPSEREYLFFAFYPDDADEDVSLDQVIDQLSLPEKKEKPESWKSSSQEEYEKWLPTFEEYRMAALAWLKQYKTDHNF